MAEPNIAQSYSAMSSAMQSFPMLSGPDTDMIVWEKKAKARFELALCLAGKLPESSIREILEDGVLKAGHSVLQEQ